MIGTTECDELVQAKARIRDLEFALGQNDHSIALAYNLTPKLSDLFGLLIALPVVTSEMIRQRLEIATDAKVAIHRLRHNLPADVKVHGRRGFGYWLDEATKAEIKNRLSPAASSQGEVTPEVASYEEQLAPVMESEIVIPDIEAA